ncbi:hypothetical protein [Ideonella sp. B508-1]|uniref:hypothetical protein n=1 Tax=Ideonella sp. B508-1 TaxID=137716 RepID=UPI00131F1DC2|nr:hypothetical protein [Ideonella sp. B508-1]
MATAERWVGKVQNPMIAPTIRQKKSLYRSIHGTLAMAQVKATSHLIEATATRRPMKNSNPPGTAISHQPMQNNDSPQIMIPRRQIPFLRILSGDFAEIS